MQFLSITVGSLTKRISTSGRRELVRYEYCKSLDSSDNSSLVVRFVITLLLRHVYEFNNINVMNNLNADRSKESDDDVSIDLVGSRACSSPTFDGVTSVAAHELYSGMNSYDYLREDGRYLHTAPDQLAQVFIFQNVSD